MTEHTTQLARNTGLETESDLLTVESQGDGPVNWARYSDTSEILRWFPFLSSFQREIIWPQMVIMSPLAICRDLSLKTRWLRSCCKPWY